MTVKDYLSHVPNDELTNRLILMDRSIMELHQNGYFFVSNLAEIEIINNEITLASFKNKTERVNSGYNENGCKQDIEELCALGICAFNHFDTYYSSSDFIKYLKDNLDMFLENANMPRVMQEYYIDVLARGNADYLYNFMKQYGYENDSNSNNKGRSYTKSTAVGRAFSDRESAYVNVLIIPSIITLVYLLVITIYFIFIR